MFYIGTAGYSYRDWVGTFYPDGTKSSEMLARYAREFSFVEVNSTYYRLPDVRLMTGLAQKTPASFRFAVKAYRGITHERQNPSLDAGRFMAALKPLAEAGKLSCVLFQFPYSFHNTPANRDYLKFLREWCGEVPAAVEFRNRRWISGEVFSLLRNERLALVCVDEPPVKGLIKPLAVVTAPPAYVRFHGRNAGKWYEHTESYERYDYLYSSEELKEWLPRLKVLERAAGEVYVSFNNHFRGQAVVNARMMREIMDAAGYRAF